MSTDEILNIRRRKEKKKSTTRNISIIARAIFSTTEAVLKKKCKFKNSRNNLPERADTFVHRRKHVAALKLEPYLFAYGLHLHYTASAATPGRRQNHPCRPRKLCKFNRKVRGLLCTTHSATSTLAHYLFSHTLKITQICSNLSARVRSNTRSHAKTALSSRRMISSNAIRQTPDAVDKSRCG